MSIGPLSMSDLPAVYFGGYWRVLGCLPSTEESLSQFPVFSQNQLDQSQWQEIDLSWHRPPILDQKSTSACVGFSSCAGMHMTWMQSGRSLVEYNPYFIYGLINNGRDQGAMISDALAALKANGVCPKEDLQPGVMFKKQFPQKAFDDAKRFVLTQAFRCTTFEAVCSAISLGQVVVVGLLVGSNFSRLDSEGVAPLPNGGGGGHAVLVVGLKKSARYGWVLKIENSWGQSFGLGGYAYLQKDAFQYMPMDAFVLQQISDDPQNPDNVPVVV